MKTTSHSIKRFEQEELIALQQTAGDKIDDLISYLNLDLKMSQSFYVGSCPVHGGNNNAAFNIFHTGDNMIGNWRCFTHNCHKYFKPNLIGFIRGFLSRTKYGWCGIEDKDKECRFREAVNFLIKFTGGNSIQDLNIDYESLEKNRFDSHIKKVYYREAPKKTLNIDRKAVVSSLSIPADYFVYRGFSKEILEKYDVGFCGVAGKEMSMRAVVPVYDDNHEYVVGCSGRSIYEKCPLCNAYHNITSKCPDPNYAWQYTKWKNNKGFPAEDYLYNFWNAKEHIRKSTIAVLVESPGNVWRLEEAGIKNSVGTFGAHLTDGQRQILDKSGALHLIVLTDPDEAGRLCLEAIKKSCGNTYNIYSPNISYEDIGETPIKTIKNKLIPYIEDIERKCII